MAARRSSGFEASGRAFDFIYWATDAAQMKQAALRGNPPTRRSVFEIPI